MGSTIEVEGERSMLGNKLLFPGLSLVFTSLNHVLVWGCCTNEEWRQDLDPNCGLRSGSLRSMENSKIYGGGDARLGEWPWMVRLYLRSTALNGYGLCGGSLLNSRHILTAAHCLDGVDVGSSQSFARYGCILDSSSCQQSGLDNWKWVDPGYDASEFIHDNSEAIATGWGGTDKFNTQSSVLKKATMKVKDKILGALKCGGLGGGNVLCATFKDGKICAGDSGGPLVADLNGDGRWVLYGVTSFGKILCIDVFGGSGFSAVAD